MNDVYDRLGVRKIINAKGPATRLGGAQIDPAVIEAMQDAMLHSVEISELQGRASEIIAKITGAQAGYVTCGAAAGLLLGTAACVAGLDPGKMNRLPETSGMKNEVVVPMSHRNAYDHAVRAAGVKLIEAGLSDRRTGAGVRDVEAWEIADAISDRTAAVLYVAHAQALPSLSEAVRVAHAAGVPVIVDAAAQLPPASNLRRFISEGADLVVFSGGKAIGGPQGSGILCGRRDLIASAALQNLDNDVLFDLWNPPASLVDKSQLAGLPHHGIGRSCKIGKEQIVGLLVALQLFITRNEEAEIDRWLATLRDLRQKLSGIPHLAIDVIDPKSRNGICQLEVHLDEAKAKMTALELLGKLQSGEPAIYANADKVGMGTICFRATCMREGDAAQIAARVKSLLVC